jgi:phosphodiesterase/alkaline phosphatase D-like protein
MNNADPHSWFGFRHERNEILDFVEQRNISAVLFLSADIHISACAFPLPPSRPPHLSLAREQRPLSR